RRRPRRAGRPRPPAGHVPQPLRSGSPPRRRPDESAEVQRRGDARRGARGVQPRRAEPERVPVPGLNPRALLMPPSAKPRKPVENWEQVRDEWVTAVDRFMTEVEGWARKQEWATLRDPKTIDEDRIGAYTVPRLLVHAIFGRFLFDPVCRFVVG